MYRKAKHTTTNTYLCALCFANLKKVKEMENEQNKDVETEVENQPEAEKKPETEVEKQPETTKELPKVVQEIKAQYDAKIEALKDAYGKQIAERDIVIKQLLSDNNTAVEHETVVDKINKKRKFKKW